MLTKKTTEKTNHATLDEINCSFNVIKNILQNT